MNGPLNRAWKSFGELVVPADAGDSQREDMRAAFFCGAETLMMIVMKGVSDGDQVEDRDIALMTIIQAELDEFRANVIRKGKSS